MSDPRPTNPLDEDMQHLERHLHSLVAVARVLARDVDAIDGEHWHEPYAYRTADAALSALRNLRRVLQDRWLVTPLGSERPQSNDADLSPKASSYPRVTSRRGSRR